MTGTAADRRRGRGPSGPESALSGSEPQRLSAADLLASDVRDLVISRRLPPGTRLGSERTLIEASRLSRPTVREAIQTLEREGFVQVKPGPRGGVIVRALDSRSTVRALGYLLEYEGTPPQDFLEARTEIETTSARLAVRHATADDLAAMTATVDEMRNTGRVDSAFIADANLRFHLAVAQASHNHVLVRVTESLIDLVLRSTVRVEYTPSLRDELVHAHQRIIDAIRARDPDAVERRTRRHLTAFGGYVERTGQLERLRKWTDEESGLYARLRRLHSEESAS
jgi:DNA-binding FadR family transcriptional regulator